MNTRGLIVAFVACLAATLPGAGRSLRTDPRPPSKPLFLLTEIGSVATTDDKVEVGVAALINGDDIELRFRLKDNSFMGGDAMAPISEAQTFASAIRGVCQAIEGKRTTQREAGSFTVSGVAKDGLSLVQIEERSKDGEIKFRRGSFKMDTDNAETLAARIEKAIDVADWLRPRLDPLKASSPAPAK